MRNQNKKVLVTGASGFVGGYLCRALCAQGYDVSALVRKTSDTSALEGLPINFVYGDLDDHQVLSQATQDCHFVFHVAALISYHSKDRSEMERINVVGTQNLLAACEAGQVSRFIYVSSVVAVGASEKPEYLNESYKDFNDYGLGYFATKRKAEDLISEACQRGALETVVVNPSIVYGYGDMKKSTRLAHKKAAQGKLPFIPASGGAGLVHVEDVVEGTLLAAQKGRSGERYILSGENLTFQEIFSMIATISGVARPRKVPNWVLLLLGAIGEFCYRVFRISLPFSWEQMKSITLFHWYDSQKAQDELGLSFKSARACLEDSLKFIKGNQNGVKL